MAGKRKTRFVVPEPVDNRPTPERAAHASIRTENVAAARGDPLVAVRRVVGAVGLLWKRKQIDDAMLHASERWYRDYVTGVLGGRDPEEKRSVGGADAHDAQIARIDAVSRCLDARAVIGFCGELRLKAVLVDELTFVAAAELLLPGKAGGERLIAAQVVLLLEQLVEHYGEVEKQRREVGRTKRLTGCTETE